MPGGPTVRRAARAALGQGGAVAAGLLVDRLVGDPPDRWHPVAWHGAAMAVLERRTWRDTRGAGAVHALVGVGAAAVLGAATAAAARRCGAGPVGAVSVLVAVTGGRSLDRSAAAVADALAGGDLDRARTLLPTLVGRDPSHLDAAEVARAVVESVAENTVDAVVAPALWALVGGAPAAAAYRAANTLDAMVGHRSPRYERFGWASARFDDLANLVPARVTAALVVGVRPSAARAVWRAVRHDAPAHPSPNAGVAEAAFAAALGVRLGGPLTYGGRREIRPPLGDGRAPTTDDIAAARRLASQVTFALAAALATTALATTALATTLADAAGARSAGAGARR